MTTTGGKNGGGWEERGNNTGGVLFSGLNPAQKEAVRTTDGPVLIVAGAGAGKTKTLTHRIGHLIEGGISPSSILAITFTNKAGREMRERVFRLLGRVLSHSENGRRGDTGLPFIGTFHGLGKYILEEKGEMIGIPKKATILDEDDSLKLIKRSMRDAGIDPKEFEPRKVRALISRHKGNMGTAENIEEITENRYLGQVLRRVFVIYEHHLRESHLLDFDDLLEKTVRLLEKEPSVREYYASRWTHIHVDEYQDTNEVQYRMVRLLSERHRNLCVVGDSDQNIYSWRGASIANILKFEEDYPGAKVILLTENYRSTGRILSVANSVIAKNTLRKKKDLFTKNDEGDALELTEAYDEGDEARGVAEKIASLLARGTSPRAIAILYRTNFQSRVLEEALLYSGIPYQVLGTRFYERKEVKDVIAYLRAGMNPRSGFDLERIVNVPARGVGKVTLEKILRGERGSLTATMRAKVDALFHLLGRIEDATRTMKPSQAISFIIKETGIEKMYSGGDEEDAERLMSVRELVTVAMRYDPLPPGEGILEMLSDIALETDQDNIREDVDAVRLMTVHSAKGLEFDYVFVTGMEQDLFPSRRAQDESKDLSEREEERRLFYVALTRAAKQVYLSYASFRTIFGERRMNAPSEFLSDIDEKHLLISSRGEGHEEYTPLGGYRGRTRHAFTTKKNAVEPGWNDLWNNDDEGESVIYG